jgi:hypothetical protein
MKLKKKEKKKRKKKRRILLILSISTKAIASRAAKAAMSAQETTPPHTVSNSALAFSITSNPPTPWCPNACLSAFGPFSIKIEPSQP